MLYLIYYNRLYRRRQLQVRYTAEVFSEVCGDFAELLYGDENAKLPNVYMPTAARVLENIGRKN